MNSKFNDIPLTSLYYFSVVAEEMSMTRAAEKLYKTQPALSSAIHKLEEALGYALFERQNARLQLTDAGRCLQEYLSTSLGILADGLNAAEKKARKTAVLNVVTTMRTVRDYVMDYNLRYGTHVEVQICDTPVGVSRLVSGQADMGINFGYVQDVRLSNVPVMRGHYFAVVKPDHALANQRSVTLKELCEYQLFCSNLSGTVEKIRAVFHQAKLDCNLLVLDEADVLFSAAELGLGVVIVGFYPGVHAITDGQERNVVSVPIIDPVEQPYTVMLLPRNEVCSPELLQLMNYLTEIFTRNQQLMDQELVRRGVPMDRQNY